MCYSGFTLKIKLFRSKRFKDGRCASKILGRATLHDYKQCPYFYLQAIFMIPTKPPPSFKEDDKWSKEFKDFVTRCLVKNPEERATATQLLQV